MYPTTVSWTVCQRIGPVVLHTLWNNGENLSESLVLYLFEQAIDLRSVPQYSYWRRGTLQLFRTNLSESSLKKWLKIILTRHDDRTREEHIYKRKEWIFFFKSRDSYITDMLLNSRRCLFSHCLLSVLQILKNSFSSPPDCVFMHHQTPSPVLRLPGCYTSSVKTHTLTVLD